jgi:hypothetical protein
MTSISAASGSRAVGPSRRFDQLPNLTSPRYSIAFREREGCLTYRCGGG